MNQKTKSIKSPWAVASDLYSKVIDLETPETPEGTAPENGHIGLSVEDFTDDHAAIFHSIAPHTKERIRGVKIRVLTPNGKRATKYFKIDFSIDIDEYVKETFIWIAKQLIELKKEDPSAGNTRIIYFFKNNEAA